MALQSDRLALSVLATVLVTAVVLYSLLVQRAPLQWLGALIPLAFLYLFWRFVRAHERMADALTTDAGAAERDRER